MNNFGVVLETKLLLIPFASGSIILTRKFCVLILSLSWKNLKMSLGRRFTNLNPYELHKTLINEYFLLSRSNPSVFKRDTSKDKRDIDVIRENHQFLWEDDEGNISWEKRLAKKYYAKLYKEYCVSDLTRYKENKIGLRWRTEQELIDGKGQFCCGNKKCKEKNDLRTWEVNFGYIEHGRKKNALIKLRLCPDCSYKLNYHHKKKEVKRLKQSHVLIKEHKSLQDRKGITEEKNKEIFNINEENNIDVGGESGKETSDIWKQQACAEEEIETKTREEEFDEYLDQLFL